MSEKKIKETMWCSECGEYFYTEDYFSCDKCVHCGSTGIYRTSSSSFLYAIKKREDKELLIDFLLVMRKSYDREKAIKVVSRYFNRKMC